MREETAPYDEVIAGFRGARLYAHGADGIAYLAERAGVPYLLVRPRPAAPDVRVLAFDDELERAVYLAGGIAPGRAEPAAGDAETLSGDAEDGGIARPDGGAVSGPGAGPGDAAGTEALAGGAPKPRVLVSAPLPARGA